MTTAAELREALELRHDVASLRREVEPDEWLEASELIEDAARERLAQLEGKALVIEPDEALIKKAARKLVDLAFKRGWTSGGNPEQEVRDVIDALRDAMPEATK